MGKGFGELLRAQRTALGVSLEAVASELGCTAQRVRDIELGNRGPLPRPEIVQVARYLETDPAPLLDAAFAARREFPALPDDPRLPVVAELARAFERLDERGVGELRAVIRPYLTPTKVT